MFVRRASAVAGLVLTALLGGVGPAGSAPSADPAPTPSGAAAEDGGAPKDLLSFGIAPAGADRPDDRPYVSISAPPGAVVYEHVALLNQAAAPVDLTVYTRDVVQADGGGLGVQTRAATPVDAGSWVTADAPSTVSVPPQTDQGYGFTIVPLTIAIPANAEPGDHLAGFVAALITAGTGGENAPNLELEQRVAARIYITVQGEATPRLEVTDLAASWVPRGILGSGEVVVDYTLTNTGNVRLAVDPKVSVSGPFGLLPRHAEGKHVDELLPGGSVRLSTTVPSVWALVRHEVRVDAVVSAAPGGRDPGLGTVSAWTGLWAWPWLAIGVLLVILALVLVDRIRRRRRLARRRAAPEGSRRARRFGTGTDRASASDPVAIP